MKESNQLHAVCLDTTPAIFYMNQTSKHIANTIRDLNSQGKQNLAAYSCDAGFHVFVFTIAENLDLVKNALLGKPELIQLEQIIETGIDP